MARMERRKESEPGTATVAGGGFSPMILEIHSVTA